MSDTYLPEALVLGPGGLRGYLELGALRYLESRGHLRNVKKFVGCSIGSIISLLLVLGYRVQDIIVDAVKVNLFRCVDQFSITKSKDYVGIISNDIPREFLEHAVKKKCAGSIPSLINLFRLFGRELITTSVNLSRMETVYFSKDATPDLSCIDAVLLSINIPLLFYRLLYQGDVYVDGAFRDPYPVSCVDDQNTSVLGIYILISPTPTTELEVGDYCYRIVQLPIDALYEIKRKSASAKCRHLLIRTDHIDVTGVTYTKDDIVNMIVIGYNDAKTFILQDDPV